MFEFFKSFGAGKQKDPGLLDALSKAGVIGLHMVSGLAVGGVMGYFLDKWLGTSPWLMIVFFILGIGAGFRNVYIDTKLLLRAQSGDKEKQDAAKTKTETEN